MRHGASGDPPLVKGVVVIDAAAPRLERAAVHVRLENVTRADAAAILIAHVVIANVRHEHGTDTEVAFELSPRRDVALHERDRYAVRVWVDADGDGAAGQHDLHSDRSYPVGVRNTGQLLRITVSSHDAS